MWTRIFALPGREQKLPLSGIRAYLPSATPDAEDLTYTLHAFWRVVIQTECSLVGIEH